MNQIAKTLTHHPKKILFIIFLITSYLFYYAFLSENRLQIDFSLEQMFPENDPEKEIYDNFRSKFSREDLSALMIYTPPANPLELSDLKVVNDMVDRMKNIQNHSNCIDLNSFPCNDYDEIEYDQLYLKDYRWNQYSKIAYFYDRDNSLLDTIYIRVLHYPDSEVYHEFEFSDLKIDERYPDLNASVLKHNSTNQYIDYKLDISDYEGDFLCFNKVTEVSSSGERSSVGIGYTPYYMIKGCSGEASKQSINSLTHIKKADQSARLFNFKIPKGSTGDFIYFSDCGYDGICPDDPGYANIGPDEGEGDHIFNCEAFDCGNDGVCPDSFYSFYNIDKPKGYSYVGSDEGEGDFKRIEYDFIQQDWGWSIASDERDIYYTCNSDNICNFNEYECLSINNAEYLSESEDRCKAVEEICKWNDDEKKCDYRDRKDLELLELLKFDFVNTYEVDLEEFNCEPFNYDRLDGETSIFNDPLYGNALISKTGQVGGIFYTLDDRVKDMNERTIFYQKLDKIIAQEKNDYNWEWSDGGIPVLRTRYVQLVSEERNTFIPLAFLVVVLILFFVFRDIKSIVLPVCTMTITLVWVSALMAFWGMSINIVSYLTYNLLMIIGCSNAIHIQMKYHEGLHKKKNKIGALRNVINNMGGALFLTSFTTSIGFFSLCMTNIKLTKDFGLILGIGVFIMFAMMIIVLPLLLLLSKPPKKKNTDRLIRGGSYKFVLWVYNFVSKRSKIIAVFSLVVFAIVAIGLFKIDYNVSILDDLKPTNQIYKDIETIEGNMGGVFPIEIIVEYNDRIPLTGEIDYSKIEKSKYKDLYLEKVDSLLDLGEPINIEGVKENFIKEIDREINIKVINSINSFKEDVSSIDKITDVTTITDLFPRLLASNALREYNHLELQTNLSFNPKHIDYYLYEIQSILNGPSKEILLNNVSNFITRDFKTVRFSGRMSNIKAQEAQEIKRNIAILAKEYFGEDAKVYVTGSTFLALKTADHLVYNLTNSFGLAFLIIFVSMVVLFKSFRLSLIAVLPNIIPLMLAAAVMGFQDIKLRPTTAMTFAIALGIAVDDTIHFLARFRQEFYKNNNMKLAIKNTLLTTGKAIISTTMVLSLGFAVLYFSELMPNHEFGILATIILLVALVGSIFLLPALLILFNPKLKLANKK